jgi:S-adenosylmethionine uptake transporter
MNLSTSFRAIFFCGLAYLVSACNDALAKALGLGLHPFQITFLRFLLSALVLLPFGFWKGFSIFKTERPWLHLCRGGLLFGGIALWCYGLQSVPLAMATTLNFTIPIFTLILAKVILKESVGLRRWLVTMAGFAGIAVILHPHGLLNQASLGLVLASVLFAVLDVLNKKFVIRESIWAMLLWGSLATVLVGAGTVPSVWQMPMGNEWLCLLGLGIGANLLLLFLLKGLALAEASFLAPVRYMELLFALLLGWIFFHEPIAIETLLGAALIIPCSLYLLCYKETPAV